MLIKSLACFLFMVTLVFCTSCADKLNKETSVDQYKTELDQYYKDGTIDSLQKDRAERYYRRAINFNTLENFDGERKADAWYNDYFSDSNGHKLTYRKLVDSTTLSLKPWPGKKVARAVALTYPDSLPPFILKEGKVQKDEFHPEDYTIAPQTKQVELTPAQLHDLLEGLNGYWPASDYTPMSSAACFMPYYGIMLYDEKNDMVAYIDICFACSAFKVFPQELSRGRGSALDKMRIQPYLFTMNPFEKIFGIKSK